MCGILGLWHFYSKKYPEKKFHRFIDSLTHRGPDGRGMYQDPNSCLFLGHRRLAILDLSDQGIQPMPYANKRYQITFNGEIYNFLELRQELTSLGYTFHTNSDTEVILASFMQWGEACQYRLNGMWAFAIWDSIHQELFLSRDRFGVKPLLYHHTQEGFTFASELKAFIALDEIPIEFDETMVTQTLLDGNSLETNEKTLITGIKRLLAGHSACVNKRGELTLKKWWTTSDHLVETPDYWEDQVKQFKELFFDACRIRMRSDIPLGSALSGGLDSSSIVSVISNIVNNPSFHKERISSNTHTVFCASYPGTSQDETRFAKEISNHYSLNSHFYPINTNELVGHIEQCLFDIEAIFDLPIGPWCIYKEFRKENIAISIDGHGADELLGGYHHHIEYAMEEALLRGLNLNRFNELEKMFQTIYPENTPVSIPTKFSVLKNGLRRNLQSHPNLYHSAKSMIKFLQLIRRKKTHLHWLNFQPSHVTKQDRCPLKGLNKYLYHDFHSKTLPTILRNFDRCSMAHGVEIRSPFLDYRLVCYAFSLRNSQTKIHHGYTKRILREAMDGIVLDSIRLRKSKVGFASPVVEWFKQSLKPFILDHISSQSFLNSTIWNGRNIHDYVTSCYKRDDFVNARKCWEFVQADILMKQFKRKPHEVY